MHSLAALAAAPEAAWPATRGVCRDGDEAVAWETICRLADRYREEMASLTGGAVVLHQQRADELLAALLATWQMDRTAVLGRADSRADAAESTHLPATDGPPPDLILYTSGSSGAPLPVGKTLAQLDAELAMLETAWGARAGDSVFVSTVSRHHMYGLPFSLLWPLVRGNAFSRTSLHFLEALPGAVGDRPITLVASPAQLANLPVHLDWPALRERVVQIFSAGAPLPSSAAEHCRARFGCPVTEIFGSTETGAVAWRETDRDAYWRCLPGIRATLAADGRCLRIRSPALDGGAGQWQTLADAVELHSDGTFSLRGRIDSIVKVGGKRVSLSALDNALETHPWVIRARTLQLPERKGRIGAVVILNAEGKAALIDRGKPAVRNQLVRQIDDALDPVARPRYWRFVSALPVTREGKVRRDELRDLFLAERQPRHPEVLERRIDNRRSRADFELRVPHHLYYFSGHFPGSGVLPGVVQIDWALHYAEEVFGNPGRFLRLEALKFQHVIQPGAAVTLSLRLDPDKGKLHFDFSSPRARHSGGRIVFSHD